jgi:putative transposase
VFRSAIPGWLGLSPRSPGESPSVFGWRAIQSPRLVSISRRHPIARSQSVWLRPRHRSRRAGMPQPPQATPVWRQSSLAGADKTGTVSSMDFRVRQKRRHTFNEPGHAHELTFSCYSGFPFLNSERTCLWLADSINQARKNLNFALWAFVFMPEHVHMIVYPRDPIYEVEDIRKAIKEPVARKAIRHFAQHSPQWSPRITRRRGERTERLFWQSGGGFDRNITESKTLLAMIDYIHLNPVRRGLVTRARDWRWSSARWFEGIIDLPLVPDPIPPEWLD